MKPQTTIFGEIKRKRVAQDLEWGGPEVDDRNTPKDWSGHIIHQLGKVATGTLDQGETYFQDPDCRERFVNVAALAVAALQSLTRKAGGTVGGMEETVLDPIDATIGELLGVLKETNAAFLKIAPLNAQGEPLCAFITLGPGPALEPTLAIMDALSDEEGPEVTRQRVMEALDRFNSMFGEPHV